MKSGTERSYSLEDINEQIEPKKRIKIGSNHTCPETVRAGGDVGKGPLVNHAWSLASSVCQGCSSTNPEVFVSSSNGNQDYETKQSADSEHADSKAEDHKKPGASVQQSIKHQQT